MKILPALLLTCVLAVSAHAKYSGGTGEPNDPYQIATATDLITLSETPADYGKHFVLTADIDLSGFDGKDGRPAFSIIAPDTSSDTYYQGTAFGGVFDGGGHKLSHLTITGDSYLGLFGQLTDGAQVHDLGIEDANVIGSGDFIAALVGESRGAITRCYSTGAIHATGKAGERGYNVAGLIASNFGDVTFCHSTAAVTGATYVGGLAGSNWGIMTECYSTGPVRGVGSVGALVGENLSIIERCCAWGPVAGGAYVGGLVGENYQGQVTDCWSRGAVSGNWSTGGLVGQNGGMTEAGKQAIVTRCYSTGAVQGPSPGGGLVGMNLATVTGSFWDAETSAQTTSAAGTGKTTAEMQMAKSFLDAGWDFVGETINGKADTWRILEGRDYPHLSWEPVLSDDFADGKPQPLWMAYELAPDRVRLKEINGRLQVEAVAQEENVDSIYAPSGWGLDATKEFALRVGFHFSKSGGGNGRVTLGVIPSLDPAAMKWAELEAGCFESGPVYLYEVRDGVWVQERTRDRASIDGTLYMSYDPKTDELYFSYTGYGKPNAWQTVPGLLKGRWAAESVYVILSGGSQGLALEPGDAWLDDFTVSSGTLILSDPADQSNPDIE